VADGVDRADLAFEPTQVQLDVGALDMKRVELVGGAPGEPAVQLLQVRRASVGVSVAGKERAGQAVQTQLGGRARMVTVTSVTTSAPGRGTHVTRPIANPRPHSRGSRAEDDFHVSSCTQ
jgi:hypothetical protein